MADIDAILAPGDAVVKADLRAYLAAAENGNAKQAGAAGNGAGDDRTELLAARTAHGSIHLPQGTFAVPVTVPGDFLADGVSGPGKLVVGGRRIATPRGPARFGYLTSLRQKLGQIYGGQAGQKPGSICLIGDSISEYYSAGSLAAHWFEMFQKMINSDNIDGSATEITHFDDTTYGLTQGGTVTDGTAGPIGKSAVIADGGSLRITGTWRYSNIWWQRRADGGTLTLKKGGSTVVSFSTAGAAVEQATVRQDAGNSTSAEWRIEASGGPVEITGWVLQNVNLGGKFAPSFSRFALAGLATTTFTSGILDSVIAHANLPGGTKHLHIVALGTNNCYSSGVGTTPAAYEADLDRIFGKLLASGSYVVKVGILRAKAAQAVYSTYVYEDYVAAEIRACERWGVPYFHPGMDFDMGGLFADNLHPNAAGHEAIFERFTQFVHETPLRVPVFPELTAFTPAFYRSGQSSPTWAGTFEGKYARLPGGRVKASVNITLTTADNTGSGDYYITLPTTVASVAGWIPAGVISQISNLVAPNAMVILAAIAGTNRVRIRAYNNSTGAQTAIATVANTTAISFEIEYPSAD